MRRILSLIAVLVTAINVTAQNFPVGIVSGQDTVKSVQFGVISSIAVDGGKGFQFGGLSNASGGVFSGLQLSGINNITHGEYAAFPMEVTVGGATLFVLNVEQFLKV